MGNKRSILWPSQTRERVGDTLKETLSGLVPKAWLVAKGFEELEVLELQKDSPTFTSESLRLFLSKTVDTSFHGYKICISTGNRTVTWSIHQASSWGYLWRNIYGSSKSVYGLADASLYWYNTIMKEMVLKARGKISKVDPAVLCWLDQNCTVSLLPWKWCWHGIKITINKSRQPKHNNEQAHRSIHRASGLVNECIICPPLVLLSEL